MDCDGGCREGGGDDFWEILDFPYVCTEQSVSDFDKMKHKYGDREMGGVRRGDGDPE